MNKKNSFLLFTTLLIASAMQAENKYEKYENQHKLEKLLHRAHGDDKNFAEIQAIAENKQTCINVIEEKIKKSEKAVITAKANFKKKCLMVPLGIVTIMSTKYIVSQIENFISNQLTRQRSEAQATMANLNNFIIYPLMGTISSITISLPIHLTTKAYRKKTTLEEQLQTNKNILEKLQALPDQPQQ